MLQKFPNKVTWHSDRRQRLLSLFKGLIFKTMSISLLAMIFVLVCRDTARGTPTRAHQTFNLFLAVILAHKTVPALFDMYRLILWGFRALFTPPRGTQGRQIIAATLITWCWLALLAALAWLAAEPVFHLFHAAGISVHV
ncbi:hypothetical protein [Mesorhizobium sp. ES1-1]|uniref:hypothetical protein n=1 Tax=Mesorhizobium sp. ES1-1 TaxID=2876629 RepID=UPI001CCC9BD8|nr:hypothetical protein [Mesorhizobium sp. ES1-1]MBZ9678260.1 hypothetical protein [Mesorhizobium sp. ES1-1]